MRRLSQFVLLPLIVSLAACSGSGVSEKERDRQEIRAAVDTYLKERPGLNLSAMDWEVKDYKAEGNRASAQVAFTAKAGGATMAMEYELTKERGVWRVNKTTSSGGMGSPHGMPGAGTPPAVPPAGMGQLPPGHPPFTPDSKAPAKTPSPTKKSS